MSPATPKGWSVSSIGDLLIEAKSGFACGDDLDEGVIQFRMNNVTKEGSIDWSKIRRVPSDINNISDFQVAPGDLLFNHTNSPDLVGKCAVFSGHPEVVTFSNHFLRLRPDPKKAVSGYLHRWISALWTQGKFKGMCKQWVNQATVSKDQVLGMLIPVPPLPEQRRIAAILDQAEALRTKRRAALTKLDTLAQSIFIEMFGDISGRGNKFKVCRLDEICDFFSGFAWKSDRFSSDPVGLPIIRIQNVGSSITKDFVYWPDDFDKRFLIHKGDLLLTLSGSFRIDEWQGVEALLNQRIVKVTAKGGTDKHWLHFAIRQMMGTIAGLGRHALVSNVALSDLRQIDIICPPLETQQVFAPRVQEVSKLRTRMERSLERFDAALSMIQHRAFQGEL